MSVWLLVLAGWLAAGGMLVLGLCMAAAGGDRIRLQPEAGAEAQAGVKETVPPARRAQRGRPPLTH